MTQNSSRTQHFVLTALGRDRPGIVGRLAKAIHEVGCNILDSRMTVLGGEFAMMLLVSGEWHAVAKLESSLGRLRKELELEIHFKPTQKRASNSGAMPFAVEVVALDHPGIVYQLADFFSRRHVNIEDLNTESYAAAHTGTQMFSVNMVISLPPETPLAELREQFCALCDDLNVDAVMEPLKR